MTFVSQLKLYIPKFLTQKKTIALFFALVVLFCAFFVVVYRPLGLLNPPLPLSMLSNRFYTLVLVFSGLVVFTVSRRLLYIVHRRVDMSLSSYLIWIAVEFLFLVVSLTAIAWWLNENEDLGFFYLSGRVTLVIVTLLTMPYIVTALIFLLQQNG